MPILARLSHLLRRLTEDLSWFGLLMIMVIQAISSWLLLWLCGETELTAPQNFIYYNMVVISTVGFGDFSPAGTAGKLVVALYQIPTGLLVFGAFLGKFGQLLMGVIKRGMKGTGDFSDRQDHVLLFGWNEEKTGQIIDFILADKKRKDRKILLCVSQDIEHPFSHLSQVEFARLRSYTEPAELKRVAAASASRIIIDGQNDDETLGIALGLGAYANHDANIAAYFDDPSKAELLKYHCPNIECSSSHKAEVLVRSMQDPGSSQVAERLFAPGHDATLYVLQLPDDFIACTFDQLMLKLRQSHHATLIGVATEKNGGDLDLNPASDYQLKAGDYIHYIADERLLASEVDW